VVDASAIAGAAWRMPGEQRGAEQAGNKASRTEGHRLRGSRRRAGHGQALETARRGDADLVLVHAAEDFIPPLTSEQLMAGSANLRPPRLGAHPARNSRVRLTRRWREMDSKPWFRARGPTV
jgi:hypothetical protein